MKYSIIILSLIFALVIQAQTDDTLNHSEMISEVLDIHAIYEDPMKNGYFSRKCVGFDSTYSAYSVTGELKILSELCPKVNLQNDTIVFICGYSDTVIGDIDYAYIACKEDSIAIRFNRFPTDIRKKESINDNFKKYIHYFNSFDDDNFFYKWALKRDINRIERFLLKSSQYGSSANSIEVAIYYIKMGIIRKTRFYALYTPSLVYEE
ncbi:MAG: hypothetical protein NC418_11310 [Muribaculaceae bacterium]|nr:hypothetical protein [Muribaculaceae bacterium]